MLGAVEPCVVRGLYTGNVCGFIHYVITAAWVPYFEDGELERVFPIGCQMTH